MSPRTSETIAAVEFAMELAGGAGFYRSAGLERRFRDIQAARYHPLQSGPQAEYAGAMALGLPPDGGLAFTTDNCSLTRLDHYQGSDAAGWRVVTINDRP